LTTPSFLSRGTQTFKAKGGPPTYRIVQRIAGVV
jgi:hypothetical protein